jgi:hypothetical protein
MRVLSAVASGSRSRRSGAPLGLDRQALATLLAGGLLILISFFTNYGYGDFDSFAELSLDEQIGLSLHIAALAALFGDVELATRLRDRAANEAARDRDRATEERQRTAQRAQLQARLLVAHCRFVLAGTATNRLQLNEALALMIEGLLEA